MVFSACAPRPITAEDVWSAAENANPCEPGLWAPCMAVTRVPPNTLRERLNAPEWDRSGGDIVTRVGSLRLEMREAAFGGWTLNVLDESQR